MSVDPVVAIDVVVVAADSPALRGTLYNPYVPVLEDSVLVLANNVASVRHVRGYTVDCVTLVGVKEAELVPELRQALTAAMRTVWDPVVATPRL